jgi:hypothetical protein
MRGSEQSAASSTMLLLFEMAAMRRADKFRFDINQEFLKIVP